eukprot:6213552-Pleurochrysis_carterae.AAC.2
MTRGSRSHPRSIEMLRGGWAMRFRRLGSKRRVGTSGSTWSYSIPPLTPPQPVATSVPLLPTPTCFSSFSPSV